MISKAVSTTAANCAPISGQRLAVRSTQSRAAPDMGSRLTESRLALRRGSPLGRANSRTPIVFAEARTAGKWKGTAAVHEAEAYWTQGVLAWFDACGQGAAPPDADFPIATREALRDYDSGLFRLVQETMAYAGHVDWRYPRP